MENLANTLSVLEKPAIRLIEKVSDAVGALYQPTHLRRVGKAKADVALIEAISGVKLAELKKNAVTRWLQEEAAHQKNMEEILKNALPRVVVDANPDGIDDDWLSNLFDKCRIVSNVEMQSLWSRVLAGEANMPGSFSKRTVNALPDLDRKEAELFTNLCGFVCDIKGYIPVVLDPNEQIYTASGINYETVGYLDSAGLIHNGGITHTAIDMQIGDRISYYDDALVVTRNPDSKFGLNAGIVNFTTVGRELFPICGSKPVDGFLEYLQQKWREYLSV